MIPVGMQSCLSFALLVFLLLPSARLSPRYRGLLLVGALLVGMVPLPGGLPLAGYLRGLTDELSITAMLWLLAATALRLGWTRGSSAAAAWQLWSIFAVLGVVLYPASMGVGMLDTYSWGYSPRSLILWIGALTLALLLLGNWLGVLMLTLATLAFSLNIKASDNYWDYLIDPFVALYAIAMLLASAAGALRRWRRGALTPVPQLDEGLD
ncbi:hypothetical protein [Halopseudomonas bauzanensis]|uniref:hypothetical protein n=1 Tax=Halopseudomonas bauzanensis TaxID=653930 RepID=UPI0025536956|nr:hypothetical protein [Halopseudomonas bauzanensis]